MVPCLHYPLDALEYLVVPDHCRASQPVFLPLPAQHASSQLPVILVPVDQKYRTAEARENVPESQLPLQTS